MAQAMSMAGAVPPYSWPPAPGSVTFTRNNASETLSGFDSIVTAWGLTPNRALAEEIADSVEVVHVIGDAVKIRSAVQAIAEAAKVATTI